MSRPKKEKPYFFMEDISLDFMLFLTLD